MYNNHGSYHNNNSSNYHNSHNGAPHHYQSRGQQSYQSPQEGGGEHGGYRRDRDRDRDRGYDELSESVGGGADHRRRRRSRSPRSSSRDRPKKYSSGDRYNQESNDGSDYYSRDHGDRYGGQSQQQQQHQSYQQHYPSARPPMEPSVTVVVKGLPAQTQEMTDGECKGYAFVEFPSLEYSQYFMATFAGSSGDPRAAQLIVENRSVTLEYARPDERQRPMSSHGLPAAGHRAPKSDWLCDACGCMNFAKRDSCFRCSLPRTERSVPVQGAADAFGDSLVGSDTPSLFVVARGFGSFANEESIAGIFRRFAPVKNVILIRDQQGQVNRSSLAFIEFLSVEYATYAVQCSTDLQCEVGPVKVSFAKEMVMHQIISQYQSMLASAPLPHSTVPLQGHTYGGSKPQSSLVATALQAAQWAASSHNATLGSDSISPPGSSPANSAANTLAATTSLLPLQFETHGGAYVFQPKSGYFYDGTRDFYYCPKSKLYYNGKNGNYWRFVKGEDPSFVRFIPPLPTDAEPIAETSVAREEDALGASSSGTTEDAANQSAPKIILSLAMNNKSKGKTANPTIKRQQKDIAKWGAIQKEDRAVTEQEAAKEESSLVKLPTKKEVVSSDEPTVNEGSSSAIVAPPATDSAEISTTSATAVATAPSETVVTSASTSFICRLCKRQFTSAEMLLRHEKESKLHAENLAKQRAKTEVPHQYRDRAEERRQQFGSVPDHLPARQPQMDESRTSVAAELSATAAPPVAPMFDESNPGNQMLRKMGWKEGSGLGKDNDGKEQAVGVEMAQATYGQQSSMNATLQSTKGGGSAAANPAPRGREGNMAAARARFEQLQQQDQH